MSDFLYWARCHAIAAGVMSAVYFTGLVTDVVLLCVVTFCVFLIVDNYFDPIMGDGARRKRER